MSDSLARFTLALHSSILVFIFHLISYRSQTGLLDNLTCESAGYGFSPENYECLIATMQVYLQHLATF